MYIGNSIVTDEYSVHIPTSQQTSCRFLDNSYVGIRVSLCHLGIRINFFTDSFHFVPTWSKISVCKIISKITLLQVAHIVQCTVWVKKTLRFSGNFSQMA